VFKPHIKGVAGILKQAGSSDYSLYTELMRVMRVSAGDNSYRNKNFLWFAFTAKAIKL